MDLMESFGNMTQNIKKKLDEGHYAYGHWAKARRNTARPTASQGSLESH